MNKMFISIAAIALLSIGPSSFAQQPATSLPSQLDTLKAQHQSDVQAATKPIIDRYVLSLNALMKTLTQNGNLDGALAVREELRSVTTPQAQASSQHYPSGTVPQLDTLRSKFNDDIHAAVTPIDDRYVLALQALMKTLTQNGNLDEALAVKGELSNFEGGRVTAEPKIASFAGTVWESVHDKGKDFSKITFRADGTWAEAYKNNPLRGHWKATKDDNVVEVTVSNGDVIHYKMSDDGATCDRQEAFLKYERKNTAAANQ